MFRKVAKVVMKVAPYALAIAAVVFTGGAALGILPTFSAAVGGLVTSLGISGAAAGALTGAVTGAGMGGAVGFLTGGKKGLKKGFLMGGLTGGVLGAVNPASVGIVKGTDAAGKAVWTTKAAIAKGTTFAANGGATSTGSQLTSLGNKALDARGLNASGAVSSTSPSFGGVAQAPLGSTGGGALTSSLPSGPVSLGRAATSVGGGGTFASVANTGASSIPGAAGGSVPSFAGQAMSQAAPVAGKGVMGFLNANPALSGQLLQTVGGALTGGGGSGGTKDQMKMLKAEEEARRRQALFAYGGAYAGNPNPFGAPQGYAPPPANVRPGRWAFNPQTNQVEEVPA